MCQRCLPSNAMLARYMLWPVSVCPSVCLSLTSRSSVKMAKLIVVQTMLHDSIGSLVFWSQRSWSKSNRVTPTGVRNTRVVGKNCGFRQITRYIVLCRKRWQDRRRVSRQGEQQVVCVISNGGIADDRDWLSIITPNHLYFYMDLSSCLWKGWS